MNDKLREQFKKETGEYPSFRTNPLIETFTHSYVEWLENKALQPKHETVEQWEERTGENILLIVNNAIYFADSSDYLTALYEVLEELKPEWFGKNGDLITDLVYIAD